MKKIFLVKEEQLNSLREKVDIDSLKIQGTLNPQIFNNKKVMLPEVRKSLIQATKDYYEFLKIDDVKIVDIILAGSNANYNWSDYSDVDVHLVIRYSDIGEDEEILDNMMWALKEKWNSTHDIKIGQYDVEMYTENIENDTLESKGVYSILKNQWLRQPVREETKINQQEIMSIVDKYKLGLEDLINKSKRDDVCDGLIEEFDEFIEDFFDMRKEALKEGGEFSSGNMAFKLLRRDDFIKTLMDARNEIYDYSLSILPKEEPKDKEQQIRDKKLSTNQPKTDDEESTEEKGTPQYKINGKKYVSLRTAAKELGIPHTTIQYRINSTNSKWNGYQKI